MAEKKGSCFDSLVQGCGVVTNSVLAVPDLAVWRGYGLLRFNRPPQIPDLKLILQKRVSKPVNYLVWIETFGFHRDEITEACRVGSKRQHRNRLLVRLHPRVWPRMARTMLPGPSRVAVAQTATSILPACPIRQCQRERRRR